MGQGARVRKRGLDVLLRRSFQPAMGKGLDGWVCSCTLSSTEAEWCCYSYSDMDFSALSYNEHVTTPFIASFNVAT